MVNRTFRLYSSLAILAVGVVISTQASELKLNDKDYFDEQGLSVLVYQNKFHPVFKDEKISAIEIILHGERIATNGEVRLLPTPEQWDPIPIFKERKRDASGKELIVTSEYPDYDLRYRIEVAPEADGFRVSVHLEKPLPEKLAGKAGFNLDFLPSSYFGKTYILDNGIGLFPRHPNGEMEREVDGAVEPLPLASGKRIVLSPEDPLTRVSIESEIGPVMLFDAREKAQNGWFVVRTLIPSGKTENAIVWHVRPNVIAGWTRPAVVGYNQVGYTPERSKIAVVELDPLFKAPATATVLRLGEDGQYKEAFCGAVKPWGKWMRYQYATFDFSSVREPGVYAIEYAGHRNAPFRIAKDVYKDIWHASLDTYLAEQMDHVKVREGYRIWHGPSHLDDARQAPINHQHFDGYVQGASTESPFKPGEHIPGLNVGGWYDAGDFDIRTQSQARVVTDLAWVKEDFAADWDATTVDETARYVQIRKPDGVPDAVQQIEHGVLQILAQFKTIGHAIPGIIEPTLEQYTHLGDGASKTDGKIYSEKMGPLESDGNYSGVPDDRWAFTNQSTSLNYLAASTLAAASRTLRGYNDSLAKECLDTAVKVWTDEHNRAPIVVRSFNMTGGTVEVEETRAAIELLMATKDAAYGKRLKELMPTINGNFIFLGAVALRAIPFMDAEYKQAMESSVREWKKKTDQEMAKNPWGVPVGLGTWAGSAQVVGFAANMYYFHKAFPEIVGTEYTLNGLDYVLGRHPASNISLVSGVGTESRLIAYGNNRADFTFIPGGMIPGVLLVKPDFPELKPAWPFLWYENEYVIDTVASYILAANAAGAVSQ